MPGPVSQTCSSSRSPRAAAADQHRAVVGVADRVARPGCARCARPAAGRRRRRALAAAQCAARAPSRTPPARSAAAPCGRCRRARSCRRCTSTPPVSIRVMSSSSREQALERIDRFVDAVDELRDLRVVGALRAAPRRTGPSRAAAGAGRGWRRRRTASWRGWRPRPRWRAASANAFSARSWTASASVRSFRPIDARRTLAVVAARAASSSPSPPSSPAPAPSRACSPPRATRAIAGAKHQQHEDDEEAQLRAEDRHRRDAEGVDDEDQRRSGAGRCRGPRRARPRCPERARGEHADLPGAQPARAAGGRRSASRCAKRSASQARTARGSRSRCPSRRAASAARRGEEQSR